jgi:hypothetical protein
MAKPKFAIGAIPRPKDWMTTIGILQNIKAAIESLLGQGKTAAPKKEQAMTGQDLITLGLITEDELRKLN